MPVFHSVKLNPELSPWLSPGDANLIPALLLVHSPVPFAQNYSPQSLEKLLETQDLLSNSLTFLSVSEVECQPSSAACVRFISKWADCLWFHGLIWWGSNGIKWFSMCYSERGSILPLLHPSSSDPVRSHSASHPQQREDWTDDVTTNSVFLMYFGPTSTPSIFLGIVLVSEISPPTSISGTRTKDVLYK